MIRLSKLTDYGVVLMVQMAKRPVFATFTAKDLAESTAIPLPTVSKLLKILQKAGFLSSKLGSKGGYSLAKNPHEIDVLRLIEVLEGPLAVTTCAEEGHDVVSCAYTQRCPTKGHWIQINHAIRQALLSLTLADMLKSPVSRSHLSLLSPETSVCEAPCHE